MSHGIFGWDLPPGVSVSDIPGNRPEDQKWEGIYEHFWDEKRIKERKSGIHITPENGEQITKLYEGDNAKLVEAVDNHIIMAIEYGFELGAQEADANNKENEQYKHLWAEEYRNPYLRRYFKGLRAKAQGKQTPHPWPELPDGEGTIT